MSNKIILSGVLYLYLLSVYSPANAQDVCVKKSPCSCVFPNGTGIDLSPSAKSSFLMTQSYEAKANKDGKQYFELATYYYHPCFDMLPKTNASVVNNTCGKPLSLCRFVKTLIQVNGTANYALDEGRYDFMGSSNVTTIGAGGQSIVYFNRPSSNTVLLFCAEAEDSFHVYSLAEPDELVLAFYSRNACLKQIEEVGRSFGSTLMIIFFSFVIFYLVLGIATKKFLMGATGVEVIPNHTFWMDLPNLVRDGWFFLLSGCKLPVRTPGPATTSPDPNSYDSI